MGAGPRRSRRSKIQMPAEEKTECHRRFHSLRRHRSPHRACHKKVQKMVVMVKTPSPVSLCHRLNPSQPYQLSFWRPDNLVENHSLERASEFRFVDVKTESRRHPRSSWSSKPSQFLDMRKQPFVAEPQGSFRVEAQRPGQNS